MLRYTDIIIILMYYNNLIIYWLNVLWYLSVFYREQSYNGNGTGLHCMERPHRLRLKSVMVDPLQKFHFIMQVWS